LETEEEEEEEEEEEGEETAVDDAVVDAVGAEDTDDVEDVISLCECKLV
jgi:hypothetical protein